MMRWPLTVTESIAALMRFATSVISRGFSASLGALPACANDPGVSGCGSIAEMRPPWRNGVAPADSCLLSAEPIIGSGLALRRLMPSAGVPGKAHSS